MADPSASLNVKCPWCKGSGKPTHPGDIGNDEACSRCEGKGSIDLQDEKTVVLTPNYESTAMYFATVFRDHGFEEGSVEPIISFIEQIRYLTQTDLPAVQRIIDRLSKMPRVDRWKP
jgi:DnaJ-class molecular chaperone